MTDRPDDRTQPISTESTSEQPPVDAGVPAVDAAAPAAAGVPAWTSAATEGDGTASARPVPVAGPAPAASYGPSVPPIASAPAKATWRSRVSSGRGLAVAALVVGLGLGAVGGSAVTFAATHSDGVGTIADGRQGFDRDGDGFGPHGGRGGPPPGGQLPDGQAPGGQLRGGDQQDDDGPGQLPGGGGGTGTDANGTAPAT